MKPYRILIEFESMDILKSMRMPIRDRVRGFIKSLLLEPESKGDFEINDESGRKIQAKVIGPFAVYFWADTPVREIKIVEIRNADRH